MPTVASGCRPANLPIGGRPSDESPTNQVSRPVAAHPEPRSAGIRVAPPAVASRPSVPAASRTRLAVPVVRGRVRRRVGVVIRSGVIGRCGIRVRRFDPGRCRHRRSAENGPFRARRRGRRRSGGRLGHYNAGSGRRRRLPNADRMGGPLGQAAFVLGRHATDSGASSGVTGNHYRRIPHSRGTQRPADDDNRRQSNSQYCYKNVLRRHQHVGNIAFLPKRLRSRA